MDSDIVGQFGMEAGDQQGALLSCYGNLLTVVLDPRQRCCADANRHYSGCPNEYAWEAIECLSHMRLADRLE